MSDLRSNLKIIVISSVGLVGSIAIHYGRSVDWAIQGYLLRNGHWIINDREPFGRLIFYNGPKALLIGFGTYLLISVFFKFRSRHPRRLGYAYSLTCMVAIPLVVSILKTVTNEPCPGDLFVFFGSQHLGHLHGECFPGGHASGGFALMHLYWCSLRKFVWLLRGIVLGGAMGLYQMAKGAHFFSDTIASLCISLLLASTIAIFFKGRELRYLR